MKIKPFLCLFSIILVPVLAFSQEQGGNSPASVSDFPSPQADPSETAIIDTLDKSENVTLDFKEADIRNVLKIISYKSGLNIVTTPEVTGAVTIRLVDVPWEKALDAILTTHGFAYEKEGNIITVAPIDKIASLKKHEVELAQIQPTITEVFNLKYIDAYDAKRALEPQLSERGKITVLEMAPQEGWEFGGQELGSKRIEKKEGVVHSKVLIISDIPVALNRIKGVIERIDVMPQQVLIEARIMEVDRDTLRDIGFDWGTGSAGAESSSITMTPTSKGAGRDLTELGGHTLGSQVKPSGFNPLGGTTDTPISATEPFNMGLEVLFRKLTGTQFEVMLHALEEDVNTNTLSAPRIMALNNQEASILIGTKYPILKQDITGAGSTAITTVTLDYYQDIGIQLNVVPQIGANEYINMILHPAVTSYTDTLGTNAYPIINTREAETRVLIKSGETVVIGGLLKDVKTRSEMGIPFLSKIPLLGFLFKRDMTDVQKIDLLVFVTARVVKEGDFSAEEIAKLEEKLKGEQDKKTEKASDRKRKKR